MTRRIAILAVALLMASLAWAQAPATTPAPAPEAPAAAAPGAAPAAAPAPPPMMITDQDIKNVPPPSADARAKGDPDGSLTGTVSDVVVSDSKKGLTIGDLVNQA